jgi:hypothetical protein
VGFHSIDLQASLPLLATQMMSLVSLVLLLVILLLLAPPLLLASLLYPCVPTFLTVFRLASLLLLLQDFSISYFKACSGITYE